MCTDRIPVYKGSLKIWSVTAKQDMMASNRLATSDMNAQI